MKRSKHTLSNYRLFSCDMGKLVPVGLQEALPGDTWQLHTSALIRVLPLAAPVMHPTRVRLHHFFVPHRLTWTGSGTFEEFITGGDDGNDAQTIPTVTRGTGTKNILDYMGVPANASLDVNSLPMRAYNLIWNEYYRDQDLQAEVTTGNFGLLNCAWEQDYFTSARPFTQKGDDVTLPLGTSAPVTGIGKLTSTFPSSTTPVRETDGGTPTYASSALSLGSVSNQQFHIEEDPNNAGFPNIRADLSAAGAINVNDFRRAFALQRYKEARARYGSRYTEYLRYLGVTPSDARLQRPEYLGGGTQLINFSEVLQTGSEATVGDTGYGVGDMYGHGMAAMRTNRVRRFIEEHGYILTLMSVRPKTMYIDAVPKHFFYENKEDLYQKELEYIGQQEIYNKEVNAGHTTPEGVFGYQDRYRQYREAHSGVSADFRTTLNYWHLGRDLAAGVALNSDFVECDPTKRVHNVTNEDTLWCMVNNHAVARRLVGRSAYARIL